MEKNIMLMAHENNVLDNSLNITLINENKMEVKIVKKHTNEKSMQNERHQIYKVMHRNSKR